MRGLAVFLFLCVALATATTIVQPEHDKVADKEFLLKQRNLYHLFYHVHQPNMHQDQVQLGKDYSIESNLDKYTDTQVVKHFLYKYKEGMLPRGRIFSVMYNDMMSEVKALFELFYHAKDYETFYNTACWAREHVNELMFVYALNVAILHRPDCYGIKMPAIYEVLPHYFFSNDVIERAYQVKMQEHGGHVAPSVYTTDNNVVIINSNYSGWYVNFNEEQRLSYFTEDIGLNSMYYYFHLDYPFWMNGEKYGLDHDRRGEIFYYMHQQLLARYYLERLSNGMGEIPTFSWHWPVETGYYPSMRYHNGLEFPVRPNHFDLKKDDHLQHLMQVEDYERRIRDAIDQGYLEKHDGSHVDLRYPESIEYLGDMIEGNNDTSNLRFYRYSHMIARMLLGNSVRPISKHILAPSTLEHYETSLRDPMFYQLFKRYIGFFEQYKRLLTPYTNEELSFPGVKVENVEVDKLVTYFDHQDVEITNAVWQTKEEMTKMEDHTEIRVRQTRLNHKPFTVTINAVSEKETDVVVRMYLGPKFDSRGKRFSLNENRLNFFELDKFVYHMKSGKNTIQRNSRNFWWNSEDWTPSKQVYMQVKSALAGTNEYHYDETHPQYGYPQRLVLPKGRRGGMPFYLYVIVSPLQHPKMPESPSHVTMGKVGTGTRHFDSHPMGYPFDRHIDSESTFMSMQNMHFEDVFIFHKKESDINQASHD